MYGWRKFAVTMVGIVSSFVLALMGKLTAEYATIIATTVGAYNAANAFGKRGRDGGSA